MKRWNFTWRILALLGAVVQPVAASPESDPAPLVALAQAKPLTKRVVALRDHKLTLVRIDAPKLPAMPKAAASQRSATKEELAAEARRAAKWFDFVSFTTVACAEGITELTWQYGDRIFHAFSTVDFRLFEGFAEIETDSAVLSWFCMPPVADDDFVAKLRRATAPNAPRAEYTVDVTDAEMERTPEAFAVLDGIHAYYDAHRSELVAKYLARLTEQEAREAAAKANPPIPPDTTVYVWKAKR